MEKKYRQMDGELRLMEDANPLFYRVELWLLNAKDNRNKWRFVNLEKHMRKFAGTPVLTAYVKGGEQVGDGHNFRMVPDPETGDMVPTFTDATAERIVGAINEDAADMSMKKDGVGVEWIVGIAKIWKWYARELVAKIKEAAKQGRGLPVSIETLVVESYMDGDVEVETEYEILGTTILGDHVAPAVADARIKALQALTPQFEKLKLRAAAYEEAAKKPQTTEKEGVKHMSKILTKQQMKMLAQKLADHTLLHAGEAENGTITVLAASKTGEILTCSVGSVADEISAEMLAPRQLSAVVSEGVEIDVGAVLEKMLSAANAENKVLSDQLREKDEKLNSTAAELAAANQRISDMESAEKKRRVNAAKAAAEAELERINAARDEAERINADCIKPVLEAAEKGEFTDCCDPSGEWNGAEKACAAVRDRAMQEQMKLDKQRLNAKTKKVYAFDDPSGGNQRNNAAQDDSLEAAYQKMMGEA